MVITLLLLGTASAESIGLSALCEGDLLITEVMAAPSSTPWYRGEWLEIENTTAYTVDLDGLLISDGTQSAEVIGELLVEPGEVAVLATRMSSTVNGGNTEVDYEYDISDLTLRDRAGDLFISDGSVTFDTVALPKATLGAAWALDPYDGLWCSADTAYGSGDLGSPGVVNPPCVRTGDELGAGDLWITELMVLPTAAAWYHGQWFEVYNNTAEEISLLGLAVSDRHGGTFSVPDDVRVSAGSYALFALRRATNGGLPTVDVRYSLTTLVLSRSDTLTLTGDGIIDTVSWSKVDLSSGASLALDSDGVSWSAGSTVYGDGDLGTPRAANTVSSADDLDNDGHTSDEDCDDSNATIFPGATEIARDGTDQDCSGTDLCAAPDSLSDTFLDTQLALDALCTAHPDGVSAAFLGVNTISGLTDLRALSCLCDAETLSLAALPDLERLDGLEALQSVDTLEMLQLDVLADITALGGLTAVDLITIWDTPALTNLDGLQGLTEVRRLDLATLSEMEDLTGLDNVTHMDRLWLKDMTLGSLHGLSALEEINEAFYVFDGVLAGGDFSGLESLTYISQFFLEADGMASFEGLDSLTRIDGLLLSGAVGSSTGLESLTTAGDVELYTYEGDLVGFDNLETIDGQLKINRCIIVDDAPFPKLTEIGGTFTIYDTEMSDPGFESLIWP